MEKCSAENSDRRSTIQIQQTNPGEILTGICFSNNNRMKPITHFPRRTKAFTLVELLLVIAIIAIMASLVISAFSNAAADSRLVMARQQQAVVQEAINSWIAYQSASPRSLSSAQTAYNVATTGLARLALVQNYLDSDTYSHLVNNTTDDNKVQSDAMVKSSEYLQITDWPDGSYPKVNLLTL